MAHPLNGRFKLVSCSNCSEFYKSVDMPEDQREKLAHLDDPARNIEFELRIANGFLDASLFVGGEQVKQEKVTFGEPRDGDFKGVKYTSTTTLEGDKLVEVTTRPGQKKARYERFMNGDHLIVVMTSDGDVKGRREFVRV